MNPHLTALAGALIAFLPTASLLADDPAAEHPTCAETASRVLEPFEQRLDAAIEADRQYAEQNAEHERKIREQIARLRATDQAFAEAQAKDDQDNADHIRWAGEAVSEITSATDEKIAELRSKAAEAEQAGRESAARAIARQASDLAAKLSAGEVSGYKEELRFSATINRFREYGQQVTARRAERNAEYARGEVAIYHPELRATANGQTIDKWIDAEQEKLAKCMAREFAYYMAAIRSTMTGEGIDTFLDKREEELRDALARIAAGTFVLYVPTLRYTLDRNRVEEIVAKRRQELADVRASWGQGTFTAYNPIARSTLGNGAIQDRIAAEKDKLAEYSALGDAAPAYAKGGTRTGEAIRKSQAAARERGDAKGAAAAAQIYAAWQQAVAKRKQEMADGIAHWEEILRVHHDLWEAKIHEIEEDLATRLTWALGETPCGGAAGKESGDRALVDRHRRVLAANSETDAEAACRQARYDDKVFVTDEGVVLGSPRDGLRDSLSDLSMGDAFDRPPSKEQLWSRSVEFFGTNLSDSAAAAKWVGDQAELAGHGEALRQILAAQRRLAQLAKRAQTLRPSNGQLLAHSKAIAEEFADLPALLDKAYVSREKLSHLMKNMRRGSAELAGMRRHLRQLDVSMRAMQKMGVADRLRSTLVGLRGFNLPTAGGKWASFVGGVKGVGGNILDDLKGSGTARVFFVLGLAKAYGETVQRIEAGTDGREAIGRGFTNLVIDLAIAGVPLTAAAEMVSALALNAVAAYTGDPSYVKATPSEIAKWLAQGALDGVASASKAVGEWSAVDDGPLLDNVSTTELERSLAQVERELQGHAAGEEFVAERMRMRERFRELLRAKQGLDCD